MCSSGINGELRGKLVNPGSTLKMAVKAVCEGVCVLSGTFQSNP